MSMPASTLSLLLDLAAVSKNCCSPLESFTHSKPCWPSLSFFPFLLPGEKDGAEVEGRAGSRCQAGVLLPKRPADNKVLLRLGAGGQKSKCHPLAVERPKDLSPASDRRQGTVAHFLILAGRLAGILPRQTSAVSARADLLLQVLFQIARLDASLTFGRWCAGRRKRGNLYPFLRRLVKVLSLLQDSKTHTLY